MVTNGAPRAKFPSTETFYGFNKPSRLEGDVFDCEVDGDIPTDIDGTFYRVQPDHRFPPMFSDDIHFNGDGSVSAVRIANGRVDFKHRYVHTDRYKVESAERKSLFGKYRNPFTDHPSVEAVIRTAANTNVFFWRGALLATKEDGPPFAMDPVSLETIGRYDFDGQVLSPTFTAHPKFDPVTGEMVCFGYEAGGNGNDGSCDIVVYTIDPNGKKTEEAWYEAPFCGMIHDCGLSENYLVLPMTPLKSSLDRMKEGGRHWAWDPKEDQLYGIVPRRGGKPEDIAWLRADNVAERNKTPNQTVRWVFDPKSKTDTRVTPFEIMNTVNGEFSRIDDRFVTKEYQHFWQALIDPSRPYDFEKCGSPAGGLFNCLGHFTWDKKVRDIYWAGPTATFQEPTFIPKDSGIEGDGYIIAFLNHLDVLRNDIVILDAQNLKDGPIATIRLPFKLRLGLHGNFVDHKDITAWQKRREEGGEVGPVRAATEPLPWQKQLVSQ
ncbi:uncharacterized protein N7479_001243 [Penicillium vulpinum]|uniref:uncharacterized protein n=1 Tax=Penicillium vulpinum TaxID=29845 RepID=UPI002546CBE5|nr:uncharacterized protein N7479_001243 [Penicillium vulpinum]KAJ5971325.1 hypothetical protein N7479_001243 [Penicillium vulpinum]